MAEANDRLDSLLRQIKAEEKPEIVTEDIPETDNKHRPYHNAGKEQLGPRKKRLEHGLLTPAVKTLGPGWNIILFTILCNRPPRNAYAIFSKPGRDGMIGKRRSAILSCDDPDDAGGHGTAGQIRPARLFQHRREKIP